jgi:DNA-binding NarL/FixJ family response regulator
MAIGDHNDMPADMGQERSRDPRLSRPRLFILSEIRVLCEGLALALSHQPTVTVVGFSDLSAPPMSIAAFGPDVLLLDVARPSSLKACRLVRQVLPAMKIVAFAVAEVDQEIIACAEAGVSGFVSSSGSSEDIVAAAHRAVRGELLCSPRTAALLFNRLAMQRTVPGNDILTRREHEIVTLVEKGLSNKEIARNLRIGDATVKNHVHSILTKLQVRRRGEAAAQIRRHPT